MILGVTGFAQNGKTTIANYLAAHYGFTILSYADGVRDMALAIDPIVEYRDPTPEEGIDVVGYCRYSRVLSARGYEAAKQQADVRRLLQRIGTEGGRGVLGPDVWVDALRNKLADTILERVNIVVPDVRFENEAAFIKSMGGDVWRVVHTGRLVSTDLHPSEANTAGLSVDYTLEADSVDTLHAAVRGLMAQSYRTEQVPS